MCRDAPTRRAARALALALLLVAALLAVIPVPATAQGGAAELTAGSSYPLRGEPVEIRLAAADGTPLPGVAISAHYRPNSETAHSEELGSTDADGVLEWVPTDAGVVTLEAAGEAGAPPLAQAQVAVRFGGFPAVGLLVMVVAAVVLFGGAAVGFRLLLAPTPSVPAVEPPST